MLKNRDWGLWFRQDFSCLKKKKAEQERTLKVHYEGSNMLEWYSQLLISE
jgi:hypothetical protein